MSEHHFQQLLSLINQQTESQENLTEQLTKANALMQFALNEDFLEHSKSIVHSYLWALSDVIEQAKTLSEQILDALMKNTPTHLSAYTECS